MKEENKKLAEHKKPILTIPLDKDDRTPIFYADKNREAFCKSFKIFLFQGKKYT